MENTTASSGTGVGPGVGPGSPPVRRRRRFSRIVFAAIVLVILILVSIPLYRSYASWESTDDAQIDGYIYPATPRVSGYVTRVTVDDNQYVEAGTVLVQLDPKDYEVALANAKAALSSATAAIGYPQAMA